jgi:hypothetical protein
LNCAYYAQFKGILSHVGDCFESLKGSDLGQQ